MVSAVVIHLRADHPLPSLPSRTPRALAALVGPAATASARSAAQAPPSGPIPPPSAHARHSLLPPSLRHPPRPWSAVRIRSPARRARARPLPSSTTKCGACFLVPFFCRQLLWLFWPSSILSTKISPFLPGFWLCIGCRQKTSKSGHFVDKKAQNSLFVDKIRGLIFIVQMV